MEKAKIKNIIIQSIIILMGILLLVSLAFPLIKATYTTYDSIFGYNYSYDETYTDTGFKMLDFKSSLPYVDRDAHVVSVILGLFAFLQLFLSLGIIAIGIIGFFIENEKLKKAAFILMIVGVSFSFWYMIEGVLYSKIYPEMGNGSTASTTAWLAFILCALPFTAYMLFKYVMKIDYILPADHPNGANVKPKQTIKSTTSRITLLKQYKELLDQGIITQEEFDEKKKELI